jgi:GNAT superfamily N-acetyltransferase
MYGAAEAITKKLKNHIHQSDFREIARLYKETFGHVSTENPKENIKALVGYAESCDHSELVTLGLLVFGDNDSDVNFLKNICHPGDAASVVVREAAEADIPDICRIINQLTPGKAHDYKGAKAKFTNRIKPSPDYYLWVATIGDKNPKVVGTAMMHLQHKLSYHCGTAAHLEDVVVDGPYRGKGIGEKLVQVAIDTAKERRCYKLMLTCFPKTVPYYEKFQFTNHDIGMRLELMELYPTNG